MTPPLLTRIAFTLALAALAACQPVHAQTAGRPSVRVVLDPTVVDAVSGVAWNAMTEECRRIWTPEGVDVSWRWGREDLPSAALSFPVLFDDGTVRGHDPKHGEAFGVTLFLGYSRRILVSAPRARQLVAATRKGISDSGDALTLDIALGRVLGRVLAHEVGHALLLTTRHATEGLMSPHLHARAVRTIEAHQFALSATDRERLAMRLSGLGTSEPPRRADASVAATAPDRNEPAAVPRETAAGITATTSMDASLPLPFPLRGPR
jgi:hypothetical protein